MKYQAVIQTVQKLEISILAVISKIFSHNKSEPAKQNHANSFQCGHSPDKMGNF